MMHRRLGFKRLQLLAMAVLFIGLATTASAQPAGFTEEVVIPGLNLPVGLAFGTGGVMYIWQKGGTIRIAQDGQLLPQPLLDLTDEVNTYWTRGMAGLALDPDFDANGYLYLAYTVDWEYYSTGGNPNQALLDTNHDTFGRVVRYTLDSATRARFSGSTPRPPRACRATPTTTSLRPARHARGRGRWVFGTPTASRFDRAPGRLSPATATLASWSSATSDGTTGSDCAWPHKAASTSAGPRSRDSCPPRGTRPRRR